MKIKIKPLFITLALLLMPVMVQAQVNYAIDGDTAYVAYSPNAAGNIVIANTYGGYPVTSIGDEAFYNCTSLTSVTIGTNVTSIGEEVFAQCYDLTNVTIPNSVTSIEYGAFYSTALTSVTIPNSVTTIGDLAFQSCSSLMNVTIGNGVTSIGVDAFDYCTSLTSVTIGNGVTSIGGAAFAQTALTSVTIPNSVTNIGDIAFFECTSLTAAYFQGNAPPDDGTVFFNPTTVYYLPGTTGWDSTFGSVPTAFWTLPYPLILNQVPGFGVQPGGFGFTVSWATNLSIVVQACTNLANPVWIPVSTSTLTSGTNYFSDPQWTNYPERFYRAARAYTVGGSLTGLPAGDTVTLQDNGSDNLTLSNNGTFTFPTALPNGQAYSVTVSGTSGGTEIDLPVTANGSGTISGANVTNVAVQCTSLFTGNLDVDMYNAAVSDGTANGGVPGVMLTENGGPFRVTAVGQYSVDVALHYSSCVFTVTVGTGSCSSTTFPSGTQVIQFGGALVCGGGPYGY